MKNRYRYIVWYDGVDAEGNIVENRVEYKTIRKVHFLNLLEKDLCEEFGYTRAFVTSFQLVGEW